MVQLETVASGIEARCFTKPVRRVSFAGCDQSPRVCCGCCAADDCDAGGRDATDTTAHSFGFASKAVHVHCSCSAGVAERGAEEQTFACIRVGHAGDQGRRSHMEDVAVAVAGGIAGDEPLLSGMLAVFDGHNGSHAAEFAGQHILQHVVSSKHFPTDISSSLADAFVAIDQQYYAALRGCTGESAGTTALAALVWGNTVYVANAGDSRAVISQSGKAVDLTRDHKPHVPAERERIEASGGFVCTEGLLNGELAVARAIGDFHIPELKQLDASGGPSPLTAEPEVTTHQLQEGDEFILLGCDGLWDVFPSQRAVEFARARLREHNDPQRCAQELVDEALRMHSSDNITVICCCFGDEPPKRRVYGSGRFSRSVSRDALSSLAAALLD